MNRGNSNNIIRVLAGGYLLYLAYQMIQSLRAGDADPAWVIIAATVLFVVSGAVILYYGIRGVIQQSQMSDEEIVDANLNEELEAEEELYGEFVEPGLTDGKMKSIEQELDKLKAEDATCDSQK
jgi:hypothetical protein